MIYLSHEQKLVHRTRSNPAIFISLTSNESALPITSLNSFLVRGNSAIYTKSQEVLFCKWRVLIKRMRSESKQMEKIDLGSVLSELALCNWPDQGSVSYLTWTRHVSSTIPVLLWLCSSTRRSPRARFSTELTDDYEWSSPGSCGKVAFWFTWPSLPLQKTFHLFSNLLYALVLLATRRTQHSRGLSSCLFT